MDFTQEQASAITNYLTAQIALDKHLAQAKIGYNPKFTDAVKSSVSELKRVFAQDEVDFITSAAYRDDLVKVFVEGVN